MTTLPPSPELASQRAGRGRTVAQEPRRLRLAARATPYLQGIIARGTKHKARPEGQASSVILERETRLELATPTLARSCSTN